MTSPLPSVDIIIPTYNQADFLREALQSVIHQDYEHWNALVINNLSTDHTRAVVEAFKDPRIKIIDFANDGVIAASRNVGITRSSATYIAFLDSDDWWFPKKLSRCIERLESGADLVCHAEEWCNGSSTQRLPMAPSRAHDIWNCYSRATASPLPPSSERLPCSNSWLVSP